MYCKNCGKQIQDKTKICPACGCAINKIKNRGCVICVILIFAVPMSLLALAWFVGIIATLSKM